MTSTEGGTISIASGAVIDVSAYQFSQGDAGSVSFYAPAGVTLSGTVLGNPYGGKGGSFSIVTGSLDTVGSDNRFSDLDNKLKNGGFTGTVSIEASTGNIAVESTVSAGSVTITADGGSAAGTSGNITVDGEIDANGSGASVALYAWNNLTLNGTINARTSNGNGGSVFLDAGHVASWTASSTPAGSGTGTLTINHGSLIDVSGVPADPDTGTAAGAGGSVYFRAYNNGTASNMALGSGIVDGASTVVAETTQAYQVSGNVGSYTSYIPTQSGKYINPVSLTSALTDAGNNPIQVTEVYGIEIQGTGNLTFNTAWDLTSVRPGGEPGVLTLRAPGMLNINASIVDHPTSYTSLTQSTAQPSWGFNLVAGANLGSPDFMLVIPATNSTDASNKTLTVAPSSTQLNNQTVYTESGAIQFASGGNTVINDGSTASYMINSDMRYTMGSYAGAVTGEVGGNLTIEPGGVIQTATGAIDITTAGNLSLVSGTMAFNGGGTTQKAVLLGSIRTTGEHAPGSTYNVYSGYGNGGSIDLTVGENLQTLGSLSMNWLTGVPDSNPTLKRWHDLLIANYSLNSSGVATSAYPSTEGIATMAGGNIDIHAAGNFNAQAGTFGAGNLTIYAGEDMEGRFLVRGDPNNASNPGIATLVAMGNFGIPEHTVTTAGGSTSIVDVRQLIEASNAQVTVVAQGNVEIGAVLNPTLAWSNITTSYWDPTYTPASSVTLKAVTGDVNIDGSIGSQYGTFYAAGSSRNLIFP